MTEPRQLPAVRTPATRLDVYSALGEAYRAQVGEPKRESILVLLAQWALETGGGASMWRWNLGNIKSHEGDGHSWQFFRCSEIIGGREVFFDPPHPQTRFRAYDSLAEGAADYLATLRRRFDRAWSEVEAGDPADFAHALHEQHYYTASEALYTRALCAWFHRLDAELPTL